jgi:hypothetical protein
MKKLITAFALAGALGLAACEAEEEPAVIIEEPVVEQPAPPPAVPEPAPADTMQADTTGGAGM